jgi:cytochrome oxidase assembly protein ShyY1
MAEDLGLLHKNILWLIFSGCLVAGLLGLSIWQFHRLEWKNTLIEKRMMAEKVAPIAFDPKLVYEDFQRVSLQEIKYLDVPPIRIYKPQTGKIGYNILTFIEVQGKVFPLLKGWIREKQDLPGFGEGPLQALYRLRDKRQPLWIKKKENQEDWVYLDLEGISKQTKLSFSTDFYFVDQNPPQGFELINFPMPSNNHFLYALTWFFMALSALGVGIARFFKNSF